MNQLISNALGIRQEEEDLVLDPVLPVSLDGLHFDFQFADKKVTFVYHLTGEAVQRIVLNGKDLDATRLQQPYRLGGLRISRTTLEQSLSENNVIEIYS